MPLDLDQVHKMERDTQTNRMILVGKNPYTRWTRRDEPPIVCQNGVLYSDGGDRIKRKDVPDWVWAQARKMSPKARENIGLKLPEEVGENFEEEDEKLELDQNLNEPLVEALSLVDAIYSLTKDNEYNWTKDGKPQIDAVKDLVGYPVTRAEIEEAAPGYRRPSQE